MPRSKSMERLLQRVETMFAEALRGRAARGHRQPSQDRQRRQHEDHEQIGELLQRVVTDRGVADRVTEAQMVRDRRGDLAPVA